MFKNMIILFISIFVFIACGSGGSSSGVGMVSSITSSDQTAKLIDSPIAGVDYKTESKSGITASDGSFDYSSSDKSVTFKIGSLLLGTLDLSKLNNDKNILVSEVLGLERTNTSDTNLKKVLRFIQSLDDDNNPANGINITDDIKANITDTSDIKNLDIDSLGALVLKTGKSLISEVDALKHYTEVLKNSFNMNIDENDLSSGKIKNSGFLSHYLNFVPIGYDNANVLEISKDESKIFVVEQKYMKNGVDDVLKIIDISDLNNPVTLGTYTAQGYIYHAQLSFDQSKLYLMDMQGGFKILDISNLSSPTLLSSYVTDVGGFAYDIAISKHESKVYISDNTHEFKILDISNPAIPALLGKYVSSGYPIYTTLSDDGTKVYIHEYDSITRTNLNLVVLDVTDSASPTFLGNYPNLGHVSYLTLSKDGLTAYINSDNEGLRVLDISNPANIKALGSYLLPGNTKRIMLSKNETKVYSIDNNDLKIIDISNPSNLTLLGDISLSNIESIVLSNDETRVYVAGGIDMRIVDISNLGTPNLLEKTPYPGTYTYEIGLSKDNTKVFILDTTGFVVSELTKDAL
ncbi:MAG: hypothetical protein C0625_05645 [Arcobacter sp.]|nr:MAG: hypothetical protein C0625_05645 [Arcobacter sp.]